MLEASSATPSFSFTTDRHGDTALVQLAGELDVAQAPVLTEELDRLLDSTLETMVIDLRGLTFIDSSGLRVAVRMDRACRDSGVQLLIVRGCEAVHNVLCMTGMDKILPLVDEPPDLVSGSTG
jgi:anti-anti-sigma factor